MRGRTIIEDESGSGTHGHGGPLIRGWAVGGSGSGGGDTSDNGNQRALVGRYGPGNIIGDYAIVKFAKQPVTAVAVTDVRTLFMTTFHFAQNLSSWMVHPKTLKP